MEEARQTLAAGSTDQLKVRQQKTSRMTLTLVCVSVAFLVLTSTICLFFVLQRTASHAIVADVNEAAFNFFFEAIGTILWLANSAINFYIYVLTGTRYRAAMASVCGCDATKMDISVTKSTAVTQSSDSSADEP